MERQNVLVVLGPDSEDQMSLIQKVKSLRSNNVSVHLQYVMPAVPAMASMLPSIMAEYVALRQQASVIINQLGSALSVAPSHRHIEIGNMQHAVHRLSADIGADLVIGAPFYRFNWLSRCLTKIAWSAFKIRRKAISLHLFSVKKVWMTFALRSNV